MQQKEFNALLGLLATSLGIKPEAIIGWLHDMSQNYTSGHGSVAEYISMVIAPFRPQLFLLADSKRNTIVVGGSGTEPMKQNYRVEFAPEVTTIGKWFPLFSDYIGEDIVIPSSIVSIQEEAFFMMRITSLLIEARIVELPSAVCCHCRKLTSVHLPDTLEKIRHSAFRFCDNLKDINIPDSVHTIEDLAFGECKSLPEETRAKILEIGGPEAFGEKKE